MKDVGFVLTSTLGFITLALFTKRGLAKTQERVVSKALVAKEPANPEKNKDEWSHLLIYTLVMNIISLDISLRVQTELF